MLVFDSSAKLSPDLTGVRNDASHIQCWQTSAQHKAFAEADIMGNLEKLGVKSWHTATEIVSGGEMAGLVVIGFEYDSVDAAMQGQAGFTIKTAN